MEAFLAPSRFSAVVAACQELEKHPELSAGRSKKNVAEDFRTFNSWTPNFFSEDEARILEKVYNVLDLDGDSLISLGDLTSSSIAGEVDIDVDEMMNNARTAMNALDADEDGFIGPKDFLNFATRLKKFHSTATATSSSKQKAPVVEEAAEEAVEIETKIVASVPKAPSLPPSSLSDRLSLGMLHWPFKAEAVELAKESLGPAISTTSHTTFLSEPLRLPVAGGSPEAEDLTDDEERPILRVHIVNGARSRVFEGSFRGKPAAVKVEILRGDVASQVGMKFEQLFIVICFRTPSSTLHHSRLRLSFLIIRDRPRRSITCRCFARSRIAISALRY